MDHDTHHEEADAATGQALLLLAALAVPLGTHCWRALLPLLVWHWGTTLDVNAWLVALFAILPLLLGPAAFWLAGRLPPGIGLWLAGGGLVVWRLALQAAPAATTKAWAAMLGAACFTWLLLQLAGGLQRPATAGWPALALGLAAGLGLDTALRGLAGTLELVWIAGPGPYLLLLAFAATMAWALRTVALGQSRSGGAPGGPGPSLVGFGLLLFLHWQLFQNQGWLAQLAGWPPAAALGWITLGNAAALLAAAHAVGLSPQRRRPGWALLAGAALVLGTALAARPGPAAPLGFLFGLPASGAVLALLGGGGYRAGRAPLALWLGLILCIALLFLYYYSLIEPLLPFARSLLAPLAALGAAAGALAAAREPRPAGSAHQPAPYRPALAIALLLLLAPALLALRGQEASPQPPAGFPLRVMTYNIRAAYGLDGLQDVDAVARVIESTGAEVVGLQELSRGWFANGSSDLLALLAQRLAMPYTAMGPAMDPVAGNAILSRYPILDSGHVLLPLAGALVPRSVVWAKLDLGGGETLLVANTHLDADETAIRQAQLSALLAQWPAGSHTVLLGDMNAEPGSGEIAMIGAAGYRDAGPAAGAGALTTHRDHVQRIDWIFHSPDLLAREAVIIPSRASDHLPVAATIERRP